MNQPVSTSRDSKREQFVSSSGTNNKRTVILVVVLVVTVAAVVAGGRVFKKSRFGSNIGYR